MTWDEDAEDAEKLKHKEMAIETMISCCFSVKPAAGSRNDPTFSSLDNLGSCEPQAVAYVME